MGLARKRQALVPGPSAGIGQKTDHGGRCRWRLKNIALAMLLK